MAKEGVADLRRGRSRPLTRARPRRGFSLVELLVAVSVVAVLVGLLIPAVQAAREAARRAQCANNLKQLGVAIHSYLSINNTFPPIMLSSGSARPGDPPFAGNCFSPMVRVLPYLELSAHFDAVNFQFLPDFGPGLGANQTVMASAVSGFLCPSDGAPPVPGYGRVNYRFSIGPTTMLSDGTTAPQGRADARSGAFVCWEALPAAAFTDGLSGTVGVSERLQGDWTKQTFRRGGDYRLRDGGYLGVDADGAASVCRSLAPIPDAPHESRGGESWFLTGLHFTNYNHCSGPNRSDDCSFVSPTGSVHDRHMVDGSFSATSAHPGGVSALMMGGEVRFVKDSIGMPLWRALGTRASGEVASSE